MLEVPVELLERRDAYCGGHDVVIQIEAPDWGLDAYLWRTDSETILKVHRYDERFQKELATYRRLAERSITRLKGFQFPQMVDYDAELNILELSIVSPQTSDLWSAVTRHRFLFQSNWLWERRAFVLPTSPEIEMKCSLFSHADRQQCRIGKAKRRQIAALQMTVAWSGLQRHRHQNR